MPDDKDDKQDRKEKVREGTYAPASGGISPGAHPGGTKPTEDPRDDAGLNKEDPAPEQHKD
jgi:hypothetical protein